MLLYAGGGPEFASKSTGVSVVGGTGVGTVVNVIIDAVWLGSGAMFGAGCLLLV